MSKITKKASIILSDSSKRFADITLTTRAFGSWNTRNGGLSTTMSFQSDGSFRMKQLPGPGRGLPNLEMINILPLERKSDVFVMHETGLLTCQSILVSLLIADVNSEDGRIWMEEKKWRAQMESDGDLRKCFEEGFGVSSIESGYHWRVLRQWFLRADEHLRYRGTLKLDTRSAELPVVLYLYTQGAIPNTRK